MEPNVKPKINSLTIPIAIIIGFALIAVAIFFTAESISPPSEKIAAEGDESAISGIPKPVDETDYIRGNPNAPILLIEYSDYDCPFCKQFHTTMRQIMDEYGISGQVAWVYRQFPIASLHPNSPKISQAALCVGKLGGDDAFWTFTDLIFDKREGLAPTNVTAIPSYAETAGVDRDAYIACMNSDETVAEVEASVKDGMNVGVTGTPYTVITVGNQQAVINGAQPYESVKGIIENLLNQLNGAPDSTATSS